MLRLDFIVECGIARFLCAIRIFEIRASSSSLGYRYLCTKFCFFGGLHCSASQWRKIAHSITHSHSLVDVARTKALALQNNTKINKQPMGCEA